MDRLFFAAVVAVLFSCAGLVVAASRATAGFSSQQPPAIGGQKGASDAPTNDTSRRRDTMNKKQIANLVQAGVLAVQEAASEPGAPITEDEARTLLGMRLRTQIVGVVQTAGSIETREEAGELFGRHNEAVLAEVAAKAEAKRQKKAADADTDDEDDDGDD